MLYFEDGFEPPLLILVMKHHDGDDAKLLLASMALSDFTLQILQKAVSETIEGAFAAGILFVARAAVGTSEFHGILLRIAVQGSPPGAAHSNYFDIVPVHGDKPPRSTSDR
jgi:hypothetical protein